MLRPVYFSLSQGLSQPLTAPAGTYRSIIDHMDYVERNLGVVRHTNDKGAVSWLFPQQFSHAGTSNFCETVLMHNDFVRKLYKEFSEWAKTPPQGNTEKITPELAQHFWCSLVEIYLPLSDWSREYYIHQMDSCFNAMVHGETFEGAHFGAQQLTVEQASAVIGLFSQYLDTHDTRLLVPDGETQLYSSDDGGYHWCEKCSKAKTDDSAVECGRKCPDCPLRKMFYEFDDN